MAHYGIEKGYDSEAEAAEAVPDLIARLKRQLNDKGYARFQAPPLPETFTGTAYIESGCRIIVQYILPWLPSRWADQFAVRVDTLVGDD